ncbi:copper chaperone PCu(A)C [Salinisphaera orenii]|nr:copper chaperone PCu(A)C [Salinisphaera halophila]
MQRFQRPAGLGVAVLLAAGLSACGQSEAPGCGGLQVGDPWVREAPSGMDVMGAYFTLDNSGDDTVVVNGVSSTQFERAEVHETVVNDDGQASMQPMERVVVPAGERVAFEPGGRHVMLFSPSQPYAAGDQVELILSCGSQDAELPAAAIVRANAPGVATDADAEPGMNHEDMNHGDADGNAGEADEEPAGEDAAGENETAGAADDSATAE